VAWPESSLPVDSCGLDVLLPELLVLVLLLDESELVVVVVAVLVVWSAACAAIPMPIEPASPAAIRDAVSTDVRRRPWSRFIKRLRVG
jgi:hypothetical protein